MSRPWCCTARWPTGVAILILSASSIAAQSPIPTTHPLTVTRFVEINFTDQDARAVLDEMTVVVQTDDSLNGTGPADVECAVGFELRAPVQVFDAGTGTIATAADFYEVIDQPGDVKVVESIDWCRVPDPTVAGCALRNGSFVVEAEHNIDFAGPLWAHEFGHVNGLNHRRGEPLMTMNARVFEDSRRLADFECAEYR